MGYPNGVSLAVVSGGTAFTAFGDDVPVQITVTPRFPKQGGGFLTRVVHAATGWVMTSDPDTFTAEAGTEVSFSVPHVDQSGFRDPAQNAYTGWYYEVKVVVGAARGRTKTAYTQTVSPVVGQALVDLDLVPEGQNGSPQSVAVPEVLSVNGMTGAVVIDTGQVEDGDVAALMQDTASQTNYALSLAVDPMVDEKVPPLVTEQLAADATVAQAAADAVDAELVDRQMPNIIDVETGDETVYGLVGDNEARTFVEWDAGGKPTGAATALMEDAVLENAGIDDRDDITHLAGGLSSEDGKELLWFKSDGSLTEYSQQKFAAAAGGVSAYPDRAVSMFTDSMGLEWNDELAIFTGLDVWTGAHGGQTSSEVAARQGGTRALFVVPGNTIPATGSFSMVSWTVNPVFGATFFARKGTIGGVHGTLTYSGTTRTDGTLTFTRTEAGEAVTVPSPVEFVCDEEQHNDRILVLFCYTNDAGMPISRTLSNLRSMVDRQDARVKRVLLMQAFPNEAWTPGTAQRDEYDARDAAVAAAFPEHYAPAKDWVLENAEAIASAVGVTLTAQDQADITNGIVPTSFRSDSIHLTSAVKTELAKWVAQRFEERGWTHTVNA